MEAVFLTTPHLLHPPPYVMDHLQQLDHRTTREPVFVQFGKVCTSSSTMYL